MEDIVLYDGAERLTFNPKTHRYTRKGKVVPSVTTILGVISKPFLIPWAVNETARFVLEKWLPYTSYSPDEIFAVVDGAKKSRTAQSGVATEIGRKAHEWIEDHIGRMMGGFAQASMPDDWRVKLSIEAFLQWERSHEIEYLYSERRCYSREMNYSGTVDLIARVDGVLSVIDFKTSKAIYPDYFLQGAAYAQALWEEGIIPDLENTQIIIVRIPKDGGELEVGVGSDVPALASVFRNTFALWEYTTKGN